MSLAPYTRQHGSAYQPPTNSFSPRHEPSPPKAAPTLDIHSLQAASRVLQEYLVKDAQAVPDLGEMLTIRATSRPPLVGPNANIYTPAGGQSSALYSVFPDDCRVPFQKRRLIGIPESLFQFYNSMSADKWPTQNFTHVKAATNVLSHMGLLSELDRVWVAIDNKLILWDYVDGCVVHKPRRGFFSLESPTQARAELFH